MYKKNIYKFILRYACRQAESNIAPYLTQLQKRVQEDGIQVGLYPVLQHGVTVSLIGKDEQRIREIGEEVSNMLGFLICRFAQCTWDTIGIPANITQVVKEIQGEVVETKRTGEDSDSVGLTTTLRNMSAKTCHQLVEGEVE